MKIGISQLLAILQAAEAIAGSDVAKRLLPWLSQEAELTPEQKANLDANYESLIEIRSRLRAELGQ